MQQLKYNNVAPLQPFTPAWQGVKQTNFSWNHQKVLLKGRDSTSPETGINF